LKVGLIDCSETSARNYRYSLRNNPEERSSTSLRKSNITPNMHFIKRSSVGCPRSTWLVIRLCHGSGG